MFSGPKTRLLNVSRPVPLHTFGPSLMFLDAAEVVLADDWSGHGFVGRDELVEEVLGRIGFGECAQAADAAERALLSVAARENPKSIVYDEE